MKILVTNKDFTEYEKTHVIVNCITSDYEIASEVNRCLEERFNYIDKLVYNCIPFWDNHSQVISMGNIIHLVIKRNIKSSAKFNRIEETVLDFKYAIKEEKIDKLFIPMQAFVEFGYDSDTVLGCMIGELEDIGDIEVVISNKDSYKDDKYTPETGAEFKATMEIHESLEYNNERESCKCPICNSENRRDKEESIIYCNNCGARLHNSEIG